MVVRFVRLFALAICCTFLAVGCTKPAKKATIRLDVPQKMNAKVGTLSFMLQHLIINISGDGMETIKYSWDEHQGGAPNLEFPNIPNGEGRLVQVLAIYGEDGENDGDFYYGDATVTVNSADVPVAIVITKISTTSMKSGSIAGRYYLPGGFFKTGSITTKYAPVNGRPPMIVDYAEMFGGWFSVFGLQDAPFTYELEGYGPMFGGPKMLSTWTPVAGNVMKVNVPENWRQNGGGGGDIEHDGDGILIIGKFGEGTIPGTPSTCWNSAAYTFQYRFDEDTATNALTFPSGAATGDFTSSTGAGCGSIPFTDYLTFRPDMHDSQGREKVTGQRGPFQTLTSSSTEFVGQSGPANAVSLTWKYLPGIDASTLAIDGVKIFARDEAGYLDSNGHRDYESPNSDGINCGALTSLARPFTSLGTELITDGTPENKVVNVTGMAAPLFVLCPFKGARIFNSAAVRYNGGGGPPSKAIIAKATQPSDGVSNTGCTPLNVFLADYAGHSVMYPSSVVLDLTVGGGGGSVYDNPTDCVNGTPLATTVTLPASPQAAWQTIYAKCPGICTLDVTLSYSGADANIIPLDFTSNINLPSRTSGTRAFFLDLPPYLIPGACYPAEAIFTDYNLQMGSLTVSSSTTIALTSAPSGISFYSTTNCSGGAISSLTFPPSTFQRSMSVKLAAGSTQAFYNVTATQTAGDAADPNTVKVEKGWGNSTVTQLDYHGPNSLTGGACQSADIEFINSQHTPVPLAGTTRQLNMTYTAGYTIDLYAKSDTSCTTPLTLPLNIPAGDYKAHFNMKGSGSDSGPVDFTLTTSNNGGGTYNMPSFSVSP